MTLYVNSNATIISIVCEEFNLDYVTRGLDFVVDRKTGMVVDEKTKAMYPIPDWLNLS